MSVVLMAGTGAAGRYYRKVSVQKMPEQKQPARMGTETRRNIEIFTHARDRRKNYKY